MVAAALGVVLVQPAAAEKVGAFLDWNKLYEWCVSLPSVSEDESPGERPPVTPVVRAILGGWLVIGRSGGVLGRRGESRVDRLL
jgi:hypothetical protein